MSSIFQRINDMGIEHIDFYNKYFYENKLYHYND